MKKTKPKKAAPCSTCGACPECGRAPAPQVMPLPPVIIVQPMAPAAPAFAPYVPRLPDGPIWISPQPQWVNPGWNTAGANPYPGTFIVTNETVTTHAVAPGAADVGNGYRSIWGQGAVS